MEDPVGMPNNNLEIPLLESITQRCTMANFEVLIPNLHVTSVYRKRIGWKRMASVCYKDKRV